MPDFTPRPATDQEVVETSAFELCREGRWRVPDAGDALGRITAIRLLKLLRNSGCQISKVPPAAVPSTAEHIVPSILRPAKS